MELTKAFEERGLLKHIAVKSNSNIGEYIELTTGGIKNLNRLATLCVSFIHTASAAIQDLAILGGALHMASMIATLVSVKPEQMGVHEKVNFAMTMLGKLMTTTNDALEITKGFLPALETSLSWLPLFSAAASMIMLGLSISNIVKANNDYKKDLELLEKFKQDKSPWLDEKAELSSDALRLKAVLLNNLSIKEICLKAPPLATKSLITQKEYEEIVEPLILKHAKEQKDIKIAKHAKNVGLAVALTVLSITMFCIPAVGPALAIAIAVVLITSFITNLILNNTVLKEKDRVSHYEAASVKPKNKVDSIDAGVTHEKKHSELHLLRSV